MIENLVEIPREELLSRVQGFADDKSRFVAAICSDRGENFEATYYFVKNPGEEAQGLRVLLNKNDEIPSISGIYLTAVLNENEMKEFFGLKVKGVAIDFGGHMLLGTDSPKTPMLKEGPKGDREKESE